MIKVSVKEINPKYSDGYAEILLADGKTINISLTDLGRTGINVCHDGRLYEKHLGKYNLKPIIIEEIRINITGWFYIHHELIIEAKKDHTHIAIITK